MLKRKTLVTAGATLIAAIGTAHLMQSTGSHAALDERAGPVPALLTAAIVPAPASASPPQSPAREIRVAADAALVPDEPRQDTRTVPAGSVPLPDFMIPDTEISTPARADPDRLSTMPDVVSTPDIPADADMPGPLLLPGPSPHDRLVDGPTRVDRPAAAPDVNAYGLTCGPVLSAAPRPAAMMQVTLTAPCRGGQTVTVRHGPLEFTAQLDDLGLFASAVPALTRQAEVSVLFEDGETVATTAEVPGADSGERVGLQFDAAAALQIHALEFGAGYGGSGHVWAGNPRDPATALQIEGGFLTVLGDPDLPGARIAEIYTLPAGTRRADGVVRLNVETEVTADNCGRDLAGQVIQRQPDGSVRPVALTLSMPGCDAVGELLVLKNLLRDMKIAAR